MHRTTLMGFAGLRRQAGSTLLISSFGPGSIRRNVMKPFHAGAFRSFPFAPGPVVVAHLPGDQPIIRFRAFQRFTQLRGYDQIDLSADLDFQIR